MSKQFGYLLAAALTLSFAAGKGARVLLAQPEDVAWPVAVLVGTLVLVVAATLLVWFPRYRMGRDIYLSRVPGDPR